jgi:C4-dicarboxylate transporter, DctM subunit
MGLTRQEARMVVSLIGLVALFALLLLGVPLGFAMIAVGFVGYSLLRSWTAAMAMVNQQILDIGMGFGLSVLPLFILMGIFVARSGLADDLYECCDRWMGHFRGGLAVATVVSCGGFAAVSGSSLATVATMAKVAIPSMRRYRYADSFAAGTVAAGGTLGMLIPPSTALIVYGILTETDIAQLFAGGIVPGLLTIVLYVAVVKAVNLIAPHWGPEGPRATWRKRFRALSRIGGVVLLFVLIMGGIFVGIFTPSEAGAVGAAGSLLFAMSRGRMTWPILLGSLMEAVRITGIIFIVLFGSLVLNQFVNVAGLPRAMASMILDWDVSLSVTLLVIVAMFLVLGTVIDGLAILFLTAPIFVPIIAALDLDLIWFGVFMIMLIEVSLITPPLGLNVFVMKSMMPDVSLTHIYKGVMPFFAADVIRVLLVAYIPGIVLWLPRLIF